MDNRFGVADLSEKRICDLIVKNTRDAIIYFEPVLNSEGEAVDFIYLFMNDIAFNTLEGSRSNYIGHSLLSIFPKYQSSDLFKCMQDVYTKKEVIQKDFYLVTNKFTGWLRNFITPAGIGILSFYSDVTNEKQIEEQKHISEKNLEASYTLINEILESIQDPFLVLDKEFRIIYMNKASIYTLGGSGDYQKGEVLWDVFPAVKDIRSIERYTRLVNERKTVTFVTKSNEDYLLVSAFPFSGGVSVYTKNITERMMLERKLKSTLREKEILIKEIHHRVKNNLQIVASILNLQCSYISDPVDIALLQDTQARVKAMALIHKKLYETDSINEIELGSYISDITATIFNAYNVDASKIKINIEADELNIETNNAVSLGLILNELITNVIKYAFPGELQGTILITEQIDNDKAKLVIKDNGIGFPNNSDFRNLPSLGMQLVLSLVQQLEGTIDLDTSAGTQFTLTFDTNKLRHK